MTSCQGLAALSGQHGQMVVGRVGWGGGTSVGRSAKIKIKIKIRIKIRIRIKTG